MNTIKIVAKAGKVIVDGVVLYSSHKLTAGQTAHLVKYAKEVEMEHISLFNRGFKSFTPTRAISIIARDCFKDRHIELKEAR